jgi:hypothetical protein
MIEQTAKPNRPAMPKTGFDKQSKKIALSRHAFKEWALVCESIGRGETSLIFRKGGIAEGRHGFAFRFSQFFLFPTFFHQQADKTRIENQRDLLPDPNSVVIALFLEVEFSRWVEDLRSLDQLEPFHILRPSVLSERFHYDGRQGLHVAFVRAYGISPIWKFPFERSYGGCRSWIELPEPPGNLRMTPIIDSLEQDRRRSIVEAVLKTSGGSG